MFDRLEKAFQVALNVAILKTLGLILIILAAGYALYAATDSYDISGYYLAEPGSAGSARSRPQTDGQHLVVMFLQQSGSQVDGYIQPVGDALLSAPRLTIVNGNIDKNRYLQFTAEFKELESVNVSSGVSLLGIDLGVSAPLGTMKVHASSTRPLPTEPPEIELQTSVEMGGAVGMIAGIAKHIAAEHGQPTHVPPRFELFRRIDVTRAKAILSQ